MPFKGTFWVLESSPSSLMITPSAFVFEWVLVSPSASRPSWVSDYVFWVPLNDSSFCFEWVCACYGLSFLCGCMVIIALTGILSLQLIKCCQSADWFWISTPLSACVVFCCLVSVSVPNSSCFKLIIAWSHFASVTVTLHQVLVRIDLTVPGVRAVLDL